MLVLFQSLLGYMRDKDMGQPSNEYMRLDIWINKQMLSGG